jgi:uncharacterized protein (TIGR02284 family)
MTSGNANIRTEKINKINDLIRVTRDGAEFYSHAARAVENPQLKTIFNEMAESKNGLVGSMSRQIREEGAVPANTGTLTGSMRELYANLRAAVTADKSDYAYVSELESSEDRLMKAFHEVVESNSVPQAVKQTLQAYLPTVKAHHDAMRDRKWAMEARH